jgi:TonB family protein
MLRRAVLALGFAAGACADQKTAERAAYAMSSRGPKPDELPAMLNAEPPFRYPPDVYAQRVQGNVTLRIYIDGGGAILPESTLVVESSGYPTLDSAAVAGSRELRFRPAMRRGEAMPVAILFPVYFRHPEAPPLPGDTILLKKRGSEPGGRD